MSGRFVILIIVSMIVGCCSICFRYGVAYNASCLHHSFHHSFSKFEYSPKTFEKNETIAIQNVASPVVILLNIFFIFIVYVV